MKYIEKEINPLPTVQRRKIRAEGAQYLFYSLKSTEFVWLEFLLDNNGNEINHPSIRPRRIVTPVSNDNKVTSEGVLISLELVRAINPQNEGEEPQDYEARVQGVFTEMSENGTPEFDFWISKVDAIGWTATLKYALNLLDKYDRFDRV
jgi:hypothetical protein